MLPAGVGELVARYLRQVDLAIPGAIEGFYLVGSTALGAFGRDAATSTSWPFSGTGSTRPS
jgi:hypothetical protein